MIRAFSFLLVLVFLPGIALGQSIANLSDPGSFSTVRAKEVEVGLGTKLMQVASIAFNPSQRNTYWPSFAYPVDTVFTSRTCDSFADALNRGTIAFVHPDNPAASAPRTFLGIRIHEASQIYDICDSGNYSARLQNLLSPENGSRINDWYLLSERPLQHIESSFRARMVTDGADTNNGSIPGVTGVEIPQSSR